MGAGVSQSRINQAIRRDLQHIQSELSGHGIPSIYKRFVLTDGENNKVGFVISYRVVHASNGECAGWPVFCVIDKKTGTQEFMGSENDGGVWTSRKRGIARIVELWRGCENTKTTTVTGS
jgi:hypothetical protein